jgi:polyisoprenoid-binding protein YceI
MATFAIDPAHTDVLFSAKHLMVTNVRGTFTDVVGTVELDEADPTASRAEITVQAASIDSGFGARDAHLRSDDFFATERYPEITVVSTAITPRGGNDFVVTADVTVKDVTRSVDFDVEFLGFYPGMDGARRAGFSARAKIDRKAWGLDWNVALEAGGWLVGDQIKLDIDLALQEQAMVLVQAA